MKRATTMGLALVAMLAIGVFSAGTASAHLFAWSGATGTLILAVGTSLQVFHAESGGGAVECKTLKLDGKVESKSTLTQKLAGEYTGCTAFSFPASVSGVEYEFSADETVKVLNTIVITVPLGNCSVKISPPGNEAIKSVSFLNKGNELVGTAKNTGITGFITGGACGKAGTSKTGEYSGSSLISVDATGTLSWS